jgi:radical SAM superfamily enzyme YgiQ (UPF0313 family)
VKSVLFVSPNANLLLYQELAHKWTAIEPPTWSLLLAEACRSKGFGVSILDCLAENLNYEQASERIREVDPDLVAFVTYGQNPNSGTTQMEGTVALAQLLKEKYPQYKTISIGSHTSALPQEMLSYKCFDFICLNEGVKTLIQLLGTDLETDLHLIPGLGFKKNGLPTINSGVGSLVKANEMDEWMPGYAWDLLPRKSKPLDMYRSHNWLTGFREEPRSPYAAIYTSLGCVKKCSFCMINIVNRTDTAEGTAAADSALMRYWSPEWSIRQFDKLIEMGVTTIRISDELFFLNRRYYQPLLEAIIEKGYGDIISTWTYSRIDTVKKEFLETFRKAGVKYLGYGIEAGNRNVRREVTKGSFEEVDIAEIVKMTKDAGICSGNNFIFGLPEDNMESMQETLDLAIELNGEFTNFYHAMALPGSPLYYEALANGWELPKTFSGYSFHSYDALPLPTKYLTGAEVLKFRDEAWLKYNSNPKYHDLLRSKFGDEAVYNVKEQCKIRLRRKVLGD